MAIASHDWPSRDRLIVLLPRIKSIVRMVVPSGMGPVSGQRFCEKKQRIARCHERGLMRRAAGSSLPSRQLPSCCPSARP